jgi:hypothetical protein
MTVGMRAGGQGPVQDESTGLSFLKDPVLRYALVLAAALAGALFVARAPTSFTGEIPVVGKYLPFKLNTVYVVVLAPLVAPILSFTIWLEARQQAQGYRRGRPRRDAVDQRVLAGAFAVIVVLTVAVSLQYFLILAPAELCPTRPHFEFLWTDLQGKNRITHCMSGTATINAEAPYYVEPQPLQAWAYVICSFTTLGLLASAWWRLRRCS